MKPGFTPKPVITSEAFSNLVFHIQKTDPDLYDALIKGSLNIDRIYQLIKDHEDRLINLEKSKKHVRLAISTPLVIPTATNTNILYTAANEIYDTDDMHDGVANTQFITFNTPGYYLVHSLTEWDSGESATGSVYSAINHNTGGDIGYVWSPGSLISIAHNASAIYRMNQGDTVKQYVYQDSGGNRTVLNAYFMASMIERIWNPEDIPNRMVE